MARHRRWTQNFRPRDADTFFSYEEFIKHRESLPPSTTDKLKLTDVYAMLLKEPAQEAVETANNGDIQSALSRLDADSKGILSNWFEMEPYCNWVAELYGPEMIDHFGGLRIVDPEWKSEVARLNTPNYRLNPIIK